MVKPPASARRAAGVRYDGGMVTEPPAQEGFIPFRGHRNWYRVAAADEAPGKLPLGGRHDEYTPLIQEDQHRRLPGSEWVVFEERAHVPHLEEPGRFRAVEGFPERVEAGAA